MPTPPQPPEFAPPGTDHPSPQLRDRRWLRSALWTAGGALAIVVLLALIGLFWLRSVTLAALPQIDGSIRVPGLSAPVTVRRDAHGVPHIVAPNQDDLFVAQGYVTAQDRLWQLDMLRRNAQGDLAAILGPPLLKHDEQQRVLELRNTAQRIYRNLSAADRARVDDYARGVNLYIAHCEQTNTLPPEFKLLVYRPAPWTGADSISVGLMMVETLDTHIVTKLGRGKVDARLNNPKLESDLYPVGSWRDHPPTGETSDLTQPEAKQSASGSARSTTPVGTPSLARFLRRGWDGPGSTSSSALPDFASPTAQIPRSLAALLGLPSCRNCMAGSNNWVVSGAHTASGKPLLSNDMHLDLTVPNIWYIADLRAPGIHVAGVTLPGMPYVIAGHNDHVAWGFTALGGDVQDLYLEKLNGKGDFQTSDGTWRPLTIDRQVIPVRGRPNVTLDVHLTDHGPLLNPLLGKNAPPIALKWTLYDPTLNTIPLYAMDTASNWAEFSAALAQWCWPTQNVVYADDQGHIAYQAVGRIPIRSQGLTESPIEDDSNQWQGYIPFADMPSSVDPPSGFLATANARVTTSASKYPITDEWGEPYRVQRIYKLLQDRNGLTPQDMLAVQTDIYSAADHLFAQRFAYAIDQTSDAGPRLRQAADLLRVWDGRLTTNSAAASIVVRARQALWPMILVPKLGKESLDYHWTESIYAEEQLVMDEDPAWLPPGYKDWNALLAAAVAKGMKDGHAPRNLSKWAYGSWHVIQIEHPLARFLPFLNRVAGVGPLPLSGDRTTIKQVARSFGPSQRFTMDWNNIDHSTENIVLGESGNPLSPYFRDQWNDWYTGKTFPLPFASAAVAAQTRHTLRLTP